jgi:serine/threonine-protein kinase RsbW
LSWTDRLDVVELTIPVQADLLTLVRLTAATMATRADFDVDEIEDLRLAVNELCLTVAAERSVGNLQLRFIGGADQVEVWCHYDGPDEPVAQGAATASGLSARIIEVLVDEGGPDHDDVRQGAWLRKRRTHKTG